MLIVSLLFNRYQLSWYASRYN